MEVVAELGVPLKTCQYWFMYVPAAGVPCGSVLVEGLTACQRV
jgi:hypothetical protein